MLIKNIGDKIVNIGKDALLPGKEKSYPKAMVDTPALRALLAFKFIEAIEEEKDNPKKENVSAAAEEAEDAPESDLKKPTRGKKTAKKVE